MLGFGEWALVAPVIRRFHRLPPYNEHLLHDAGAFQIGIGVTLLLAAPRWQDSLAVSLAGLVIGGGLHAINHLVDRPLGGHEGDVWGLGGPAVLATIALVIHLRDQRPM
jgi:predicted anti-sigma-YlaC factor YlaD